jgi:hypothetical protein
MAFDVTYSERYVEIRWSRDISGVLCWLSVSRGLFFTSRAAGKLYVFGFWSLCATTRRLGASHRIVEVYLEIYSFSFSTVSGFSHARGSRVSLQVGKVVLAEVAEH